MVAYSTGINRQIEKDIPQAFSIDIQCIHLADQQTQQRLLCKITNQTPRPPWMLEKLRLYAMLPIIKGDRLFFVRLCMVQKNSVSDFPVALFLR